ATRSGSRWSSGITAIPRTRPATGWPWPPTSRWWPTLGGDRVDDLRLHFTPGPTLAYDRSWAIAGGPRSQDRHDPEGLRPQGTHDSTYPRTRDRPPGPLPARTEPRPGPGRGGDLHPPTAPGAEALRLRLGPRRGRPRASAEDRRPDLRGGRELADR